MPEENPEGLRLISLLHPLTPQTDPQPLQKCYADGAVVRRGGASKERG